MKSRTLVLAALLAACGDDGGPASIDGGSRPDAPPSCPPQSAPLAAGMHELYLSFEGVTITLGDCDDSHTNCSSLVSQSSTVVPTFLPSESSRATRITTIKGMVQQALAPFSIDVVTARPASGDYWMVSVGGASDAISGLTDATVAVKAVCDATNRNSIAFAFEQDTETTDRAYADSIAGAFGALAGLVATTQSGGDCMCTATSCPHLQTCTWGTDVVPKPSNLCARTTQNEQLLLMTAVGCR